MVTRLLRWTCAPSACPAGVAKGAGYLRGLDLLGRLRVSPRGDSRRSGLSPTGAIGARWRHLLEASSLALLALLALPCSSPAQSSSEDEAASPTRRPSVGAFQELNAESRRAIEDGIDWLAREQIDSSGRWPSRPPNYQMSVTALSGLALVAHGEGPEAGRHAKVVRKAIDWVLSSQRKDGQWEGLIFDMESGSKDDRPMHGHGFALLFLSEAYGLTRGQRLRERMHRGIQAGIGLTQRSISPDGGWYYHPADSTGGGNRDEGSVTIVQIQALRSAHNAGIAVDEAVVRRAVDYIKGSQQPDGGVRYTLRWGRSSAALTSAGISVLQGAGEYHGEAVEKGYGYLRLNLSTDLPDQQRFFYYTHLYAAQAMFQRGGPEWSNYFPRIRHELLQLRQGNVYWESPYGRSYSTAIALLILQLPRRYLPIHQR